MSESIKESKKAVYYKLISDLQAFLLNDEDLSAQVCIFIKMLIEEYKKQIEEL